MYDKQRADHAVNFIRLLRHTRGKWAGVPFNLQPWQEKQIIRPLFGTVDASAGLRQYRTAYMQMGRKNGKSEIAAAIALYMLFADGEMGAEVYSAAADKEQAGIVFATGAQMVRQDKALNKRCKIVDSQKRIIIPGTNSFWRVLSADAYTKHGLNPHCVIFDELHAQPNRELWDVLTTGFGAREQPLLIALTTAGYDRNSICYEQYDYAKRILAGDISDPAYFPCIWEVPPDADWRNEKLWRLANPGLGEFRSLDELRQMAGRAAQVPALQNTFRRLYLDQWCVAPDTLIRMADGRLCRADQLKYGDLIEAYDELTGKLKVAYVGNIIPMPPSKLFRISTSRGRSIVVNAEHPFWCRSGRPDRPQYGWIPAHKLVVGSRIGVALGKHKTPKGGKRLGPLKSRFLGIMAGDGKCNGTPRLTSVDAEVIEYFKAFIESMGDRFATLPDGVHFDARNIEHGNLKRTNTRKFLQQQEMWGLTCDTKHVPSSVFSSGPESWAGFLSGYLDTDGHVANNSVMWVSKSRVLLEGCQHLLAYLDIQSSLKPSTLGRYRLYITDSSSLKNASKSLTPLVARKREALLKLAGMNQRTGIAANDIRDFDRITAIEELDEAETIGISVPFCHTHITNGLITHNTEQADRWIDMEAWDASAGSVELDELEGQECYGGLDLSSTTDITAFSLVFPREDGTKKVLPFFWIPGDDLHERGNRDRVPYELWRDQGFLKVTSGNVVDYDVVQQDILELSERFNIGDIAYDRWNAAQIVQNLMGEGLTMVPMGQGFASMSAPSKEMLTLILSRRLHHGCNPILRWMATNVQAAQDAAGNIKPDKSKSTQRIDGIVATIMAVDRVVRHESEGPSTYEENDLEFI